MDQLNGFLAENGIFMLTIILFFLGIFGMTSCGNYMKKLMCVNIMQVAVIFFFLCLGQKTNGTIPVVADYLVNPEDYVNPLPHALMLTAIVVSLGTTGVGLALLMRIKDQYGSLEEEDIIKREKKNDK